MFSNFLINKLNLIEISIIFKYLKFYRIIRLMDIQRFISKSSKFITKMNYQGICPFLFLIAVMILFLFFRAVVEVLLAAGVDVNTRTSAGTAMHEAALCGKMEVVRALLDRGVDLGIRDSRQNTVLDLLGQFPPHVTQDITAVIKSTYEITTGCSSTFLIPFYSIFFILITRIFIATLFTVFSITVIMYMRETRITRVIIHDFIT